MYCAEQINVPPELGAILKQYTKAVIRDRPKELYKFSANFFALLTNQPPPFDERGQLVSEQNKRNQSGGSDGEMVADVITDAGNFESLGAGDDPAQRAVNALFRQYDVNGTGRLERSEVKNLLDDIRAMLGQFGAADGTNIADENILQVLDVDDDETVDMIDLRNYVQTQLEGL
jgi:hypothetical protein